MIHIQSISDIITNSSSEVFLYKIDDEYNQWVNDFNVEPNIEFRNLEEIHKSLLDEMNLNDPYNEMSFNSACKSLGVLSAKDYSQLVEAFKGIKTEKEIWDFLNPIYKKLIGTAIVTFSDGSDGNWNVQGRLNKHMYNIKELYCIENR